ncbi:MAG: hypothetical protein ACRDOK_20555 [Streptosporangiaceae bacterium]
MTVGPQITNATVDNFLASRSVILRDTLQDIADFFLSITGQGNGLAVLQAAGYYGRGCPDCAHRARLSQHARAGLLWSAVPGSGR